MLSYHETPPEVDAVWVSSVDINNVGKVSFWGPAEAKLLQQVPRFAYMWICGGVEAIIAYSYI